MENVNPGASSRTSAVIRASCDAIFDAFTTPEALVAWQAPGDMTAEIHEFDAHVGGGYRMSLYYPSTETEQQGKTSDHEDQYTSRFVELTRPTRIVQAIRFASDDPAFAGEMTLTVDLQEKSDGTLVTMSFDNIPPGVRPEDNDAGTRSSLEKLAAYVEPRAN